jgi:hypothetical protein
MKTATKKKAPVERGPVSIVSNPDYEAPVKGSIHCFGCERDKVKAYIPCGMPGRGGICPECAAEARKLFEQKTYTLQDACCFFCSKEHVPVIKLSMTAFDGICEECAKQSDLLLNKQEEVKQPPLTYEQYLIEDEPQGPPYKWNEHDVCVNATEVDVYKDKNFLCKIEYAFDSIKCKWAIGGRFWIKGSMVGCGGPSHAACRTGKTFETEDEAILYKLNDAREHFVKKLKHPNGKSTLPVVKAIDAYIDNLYQRKNMESTTKCANEVDSAQAPRLWLDFMAGEQWLKIWIIEGCDTHRFKYSISCKVRNLEESIVFESKFKFINKEFAQQGAINDLFDIGHSKGKGKTNTARALNYFGNEMFTALVKYLQDSTHVIGGEQPEPDTQATKTTIEVQGDPEYQWEEEHLTNGIFCTNPSKIELFNETGNYYIVYYAYHKEFGYVWARHLGLQGYIEAQSAKVRIFQNGRTSNLKCNTVKDIIRDATIDCTEWLDWYKVNRDMPADDVERLAARCNEIRSLYGIEAITAEEQEYKSIRTEIKEFREKEKAEAQPTKQKSTRTSLQPANFTMMPKEEPAPIVKQVDGLQQVVMFDEPEVKSKKNPDTDLFGYVAKDKTDRQRFRRKRDQLIQKLKELPTAECFALIRALNANFTPPQSLKAE